jgi:HD superfamily phosphohydrolase
MGRFGGRSRCRPLWWPLALPAAFALLAAFAVGTAWFPPPGLVAERGWLVFLWEALFPGAAFGAPCYERRPAGLTEQASAKPAEGPMILRDPVHGLVSFEAPEERIVPLLLGTAEFQRLRRIKQLGLTSLAYPGADHTRFSHAIGTAHVMSRLLARIRNLQGSLRPAHRLTSAHAVEALAAALLHDVGHGPFSHLFEESMPDGPRHETWSSRIVLDETTEVHQVLAAWAPELPARVEALIHGRHELTYLARAVSGTFDVDRCDYLLRDAHFTGVSYGAFDLDWLLRSFCLAQSTTSDVAPALAIDGTKGLPAIESFILARLFMFQQVYFHKASRASEHLLSRILARVQELLRAGSEVPGTPIAIASVARSSDTTLASYLELDDASLWTALSHYRRSEDAVLSDLTCRLFTRQLLKTIDLYGHDATPEGQDRCLAVAVSLAEERGLDPRYYVGLDSPSIIPFDPKSDPITVVFPDGSERPPGEVSFLLGRLHGEVLSRPRIIVPEEIRGLVFDKLGRTPEMTQARGRE